MRAKHRAESCTPQSGKGPTVGSGRAGESASRKRRAPRQRAIYVMEMMEKRMLLSAVATTFMAHPDFSPGLPPPTGGSVTPQGDDPVEITGAYEANNVMFGSALGNGSGQTIAIVDAYDDPTITTDLATFDQEYNLQAPPSFEKLNENGQTSPLPGTDPAGAGSPDGTWEEEESLDVEWAHAMAPAANIILYEAQTDGDALFSAVSAATDNPAVTVVSMSWGAPETATEQTSYDPIFTTLAGHSGITFVAAAGDSGAFEEGTTTIAAQYPAASPNVVAVGGTTLNVTGNGVYEGETAWGDGDLSGTRGGGGGGVSAYEPMPQYQEFLASALGETPNESQVFRTYPDVAMDADPNSGVAVCDSFDYTAATPWSDSGTGGTSLACPLFAGIVAIADQGRIINGLGTLTGNSETLPRIYDLPYKDFHDITGGSNGYSATTGYDLASGRGSVVGDLFIKDLASAYIGSHVFIDTNLDGIEAYGEPGLGGVVVNLYTSTGTLTASTTTDSEGFYEFTGFSPGTYFVNFEPPAGYQLGPQVTNATAGLENLANPTTGNTPQFTVFSTSENSDENASAYLQTITITPLVSLLRPHSGTAPMVFTVTLAPINNNTVDVAYNTEDGTAIANVDYVPVSGILVFAPGVTTETITVQAIGNLIIENDVSYSVHITVPTNYVVLPGGTSTGTGLVQNSNYPVATVSSPPTEERSPIDNLTYVFVISLSAIAPFEVTVAYTTVDNTASAGLDYDATSGTVTFGPGVLTQTVSVTVLPGTNRQLDKTFYLQISQTLPVTETIGTPYVGVGTILTNEPPAMQISGGSVTESLTGTSYLPFYVQVSPALTGPITVDYTTSNGTAVAGVDYTAESGTLTFSPGRIETTVYVPVPQQFIAEQSKTVNLTLSNAGDIELLDTTATSTINYVSLAALPFTSKVRAVYYDALNQLVTVSLKGPGEGNVVFLGSVSNNTNAYEIELNGTDDFSTLNVKVAGNKQTSMANLYSTGALQAVNAKTLNILSYFNASAGVNTVNLGYIQGTSFDVGGVNDGESVALTFNRVLNSSITSDIPIRSLTSGAYIDTTGSPTYITAPSVGTVKVKGTFQGTIKTGSVAAIDIDGILNGGVITTGSIGSVSALAITGSTIFAGVAAEEAFLPTESADFASETASIGSVSVGNGTFSNTVIAGWTVGRVSAGKVTTTPGSSNFGVAGEHLGKVNATTTTRVFKESNPKTMTSADNFVVDPTI